MSPRLSDSVRASLAVVLLVGAVVAGFIAMIGPAARAEGSADAATSSSGGSSESSSSSEAPSDPVSESESAGPVEVDDAVFRWGINNESNNAAFDGSANIFSAGKAPDTKGGKLRQVQWSQSDGNVVLQKFNGTAWQPATWEGLFTDSSGGTLWPPTSAVFSNHNIVISGGTGTVDVDAGTAHVAWTGSVTVLYYQGLSEFYLSDPVLDVADGVGTVTATVQGYASSRDGSSGWSLQEPVTVVVAELAGVDLSDPLGFVATPAYEGRFPKKFVDYMEELGTGAFWQDSGGSTDAFKKPLDLTISYDANRTVTEPTPTEPTSTAAVPEEPTLIEPPTPVATPTATATVTRTVPAPDAQTPQALAPVPAQPQSTPVLVPAQPAPPLRPETSLALSAAPATAPVVSPGDPGSWPWWAGSALLLAAAGLLLVPVRGPKVR